MQAEPQDSGAPLPGATDAASESPERTPPQSLDAGHMVASTPESQKRRHRRRVEDDGTPNPLYELDDHARDAPDAAQSPRLLHLQLDTLTLDSDAADDVPLDHGPLTGGDRPSRAALECRTAELEMELLHMHNQCGQLKARLDGSQALNSELQRALVDAHAPQERSGRFKGLGPSALPAIAEHEDGAAALVVVPASPASPVPTADVALHLANTTNQVLELQSRLDEREAQLSALTAQLTSAGLHPDAAPAPPQPQCDRASLADISNCGQEQQHASPRKAAVQVEDVSEQLASERAGRQRLSSCLSALAADLQARDVRLSRLLASAASQQPQQPPQQGLHQEEHASAPATAAQLDASLPVLGAAVVGVLRELRQQTALAAALQLRCEDAQGEASCELAEQQSAACGTACNGAARRSTVTEPAAAELASAGASNAMTADAGGTEAEAPAAAGSTAAAAGSSADAPQTRRSREGHGGGSAAAEAERMGAVRRLSKQFSEQVTALKLEFSALEQKLLQRDATIAQLHADARAADKAARQSAVKQGARITALQHQLDAVSANQQTGEPPQPQAGEVAKQLVELQAALRAVQHAREEDRRKHTHIVAGLKERLAAAEAHAAELRRQLDAGGDDRGTPGISPSKASARIALLEAERNKRDLATVRDQLAKKTAKLDAAAGEMKALHRTLAAREQVLIAMREELAAAHRAHSEAAHKLRAQRRQAAPWR